MEIFVPGRICLFGEHSDWAGGYRRINADLEKGYTLITGTNQGIYARVSPHPNKLIFHATLNDGTRQKPWEIPMDRDALLSEAEKGGFFSYVAGVAFQVLTHYRVRGLEIDNYKTDLPVKKGLSSSAAVTVLTARAFNRIYDLKMTIRGEMEYAYLGEITTPSRCGRMDQGCAYGNRPVLMTFDGDRIDVAEFNVPSDLFFVIVDLHAGKDTREILGKLNESFPFADTALHKGVQEYLGLINKKIVQKAQEFLSEGNAEKIGHLMTEAQAEFDKHLQPACPSQLTAPVLHQLLADPRIQSCIYGGKGVGSQGDGTAQLIARNEANQEKVIQIIEKEMGMSCLKLVLQSGHRVRKAVIPAAGFGLRLFPASKAIKKELFPVIDRERMKPAIQVIIEEAIDAGIEEIGIIVQPEDQTLFEEYFYQPLRIENMSKLSRKNQEYSKYVQELGHRITFIPQDMQEGLGHAVYCARSWVGEEPFLLMLGDHLYKSETKVSCTRQLLDIYERVGHSVVGLMVSPQDEIGKFGCVTGVWQKKNRLLSITDFAEKPTVEYAKEHLYAEGLDPESFLTISGQYVLTPKVFNVLEVNIQHNLRESGFFQLTSALDQLRIEEDFSGYLIQGKRFDIGSPDTYRQTLIEYGK
jgi:UTP-glucose-1-phosphate uridylyltransferase/mevalonate kinase